MRSTLICGRIPSSVLEAEDAAPDFHARFDATGRSYIYRIVNRRAGSGARSAGGRGAIVGGPGRADARTQRRLLVGRHDFTTFRDSQLPGGYAGENAERDQRDAQGEAIEIRTSARSFLHRQVRSMVGSLVDVGRGREREGWIAQILAAADRTKCGPVAPADGPLS